ncbi:beta-galactosidase [Paenibacillus oralis]|uniref:Beta-galactosidase n=1 Tax=Paenibacillus oralis TaxID=2490856 RepID=A0A3P3TWT9_9BACL|nr:beta-galactosidase [Paenibacillus oralis]RRJ62582.1 beta-galactosidase [Paenibacillus oralis]
MTNGKLYHGASLYPELWSRDVLMRDIAAMKEAGINVVRMGEFAWSVLEPEEGRIDIGFFVEVIGLLYENGIETVMCTPTPTPPIWMSHGHPERMHVNEQGTVMNHGARQHVCTNNAYFRERAALITERIAQAVGRLPGVVAWQLDNEFKAHVADCLCSSCKELWQRWLERRYGAIEALNEAWGTNVWSQTYRRFEEVPQPGPTPFLHNSSLRTMYRLFTMEQIAEFADEQAAIIRRYSAAPITHNSNIPFHLDNERLFRNLDFAAFDSYASQANAHAYLFNCDLWRNLKPGEAFWVMETSPSFAASLESYATPHPNGYVKAEAVAAYALGAGGFCYWLWRQQRSGSEQPHGSVVSAWGEPTIGYRSVLEAEAARRELEPVLLASRPARAEVAITYSDRAKAFLQTEPHRKLNYRGLMNDFYKRFLALGLYRDVVPEGGELTGYKLLFTPFLPYVSPEFLQRALRWVAEGGVWVAGPLTGGRTGEHTIPTDAGLSELEAWAGVKTVYTYPMEGTGSVGEAFGVTAPLSLWSAVFAPAGRETAVVGTIAAGLTPGLAFATERLHGRGKIVMLGSLPCGEAGDLLLQKLIGHYADEAGVALRSDVTPGTLVVPRTGDDGNDLWVIINMDGLGGTVTLPREGLDVMTGRKAAAGALAVAAYEYRVIRMEK